MKKNIIIFSSKTNFSNSFHSILESLSNDYMFSLQGSKGVFYNFFGEKKWARNKIFLFKDLFLVNKVSIYLFFVLKPLVQLMLLFKLLILKHKNQAITLFLINVNEKILITPIALLLKINFVWIESEDINYSKIDRRIVKNLIKQARLSKIICLNQIFKLKIENLGVASKNIFIVNPGIEIKQNKYQENIFSKIARNENNQVGKKFFTVGTIGNLDDKMKIETLFSAVKNSMEIIPRVQLIFVGGGEYSPENNPWAKWLAKKMGIETMVWFVSSPNHTKKWLDSFDVFVLSSRMLNLDDFKTCLYAMEDGLAPIVPEDIGYSDLIINGENGYFYDRNNSQTLSDVIIKLYKNKRIHSDLANNAKKTVITNFQINKTVEEFKKLI